MYKVCIYNNEKEQLIHYPTSDQDAPHLNKLPLKEGLSQVENLSFSVYPNNPGYNALFEFSTKVKVIDIRDDSIRFTGRILSVTPKMDSSGQFLKDVVCEGALSYLNDTKMRAETYLGDPEGFVQWILDKHNEKVEACKRICPGNIDVTGSVAYTCTFDTTLNTILAVKDKISIDGDIRIREESGVLYFDWMKNLSSNTLKVVLGKNMNDMVKSKDVTSLGTRIVPLGANNLTIESVNRGMDYIEDSNAKSLYGIIEKTVQYSDVTDSQQLKEKCIKELSSNTQVKYSLTATALDLSFISGEDVQMFNLGVNLHLINPALNVNDIYKIVSLDLDLIQPYNPKLEIANSPVKSSTTINDLRRESISNNSVHNGVQVGDDFGIRISSSDGKIIITINALEGITIEDVVDNVKKFFIDTDGNLTMDGTQQITKDGKLIIENTSNEHGGLFYINDTDGNLVMKLGVEAGTSENVGATLIGYNKGSDKPRFKFGISKDNDYGTLQVLDKDGKVKAVINGDDGNGNGVVGIIDDNGVKHRLATEDYVLEHVSSGGDGSGS